MNDLKYNLYKCKYKYLNRGNVNEFSLSGKIKFCKVVDVINAQQCIIVMDIMGNTRKWTLRLDNYKAHVLSDIPKLKNHENKILLTTQSANALEFLSSLIEASPHRIFKLYITGFDNSGNILGYLYYPKHHNIMDSISVNKLMIQNGYGIEEKNLCNTTIHR